MEQIKKGTGQLEDIFMQIIPVEYSMEHNRSYAAYLGVLSDNEDTTVSDMGRKRGNITPSHQNEEASNRSSVCNGQLDCIEKMACKHVHKKRPNPHKR